MRNLVRVGRQRRLPFALLVDGTVFRLPGTRITDAKGLDMELHPRPVDVFVQKEIGEGYQSKDSQLDAAVGQLLGSIGSK